MRLIRDPSTKNAFLLVAVCTALTIFFHDNLQHCQECFRQLNIEMNVSRAIPSYTKKFCFFRHNYMHSQNVLNVLRNLGYRGASDSPNWDFMFIWERPSTIKSEMINIKPHQRINWFMGIESQYYVKKLYLAFMHRNESFISPVFSLPEESDQLLEYIKKNPNDQLVSKKYEHRGVRIINASEILNSEENLTKFSDSHFVQRFVSNPLLVGGHKFELGVYIIVTSMDPIRLYTYNGDISLRFCPKPYHPFDPEDLDSYVVADDYKPTWDMPDLEKLYFAGFGQRITLITYFKSIGVDISPIFGKIEQIITKIVLQTRPDGKHLNNFVELQRCDFLIDDQLNIFVLECNFIPNMGSAHFPQNQFLFEQIAYNVFSVGGVSSNFNKRTLALSEEESNIMASDRDILVYPDICTKQECINYCRNETCSLCPSCLTLERKDMLKRAYKEHVNRADCRRLWPPPMNAQNHEFPDVYYNLTENNQMMYKWFLGKCLLDDAWCH